MEDSLAEVLAAECGGAPEEYAADLSDVSLDEAMVDSATFDMSEDKLPVAFEDVDLDDAEELDGT